MLLLRYESQLLESSKVVVQQERDNLLKKRVSLAGRGLFSRTSHCTICGERLDKNPDAVSVLFR